MIIGDSISRPQESIYINTIVHSKKNKKMDQNIIKSTTNKCSLVINSIINIKSSGAHVLLLVCQLIFSGWHIVGHVVLDSGVNPFIFALYRELFGIFMMYMYVMYIGLEIKIDKADYWRFFFMGSCSFIKAVGSCLALQYISPTRFAIFQPSVPCIATVISIAIDIEKFSLMKALGISFAVIGAVTVVLSKTHSNVHEQNIFLGILFVSCQVVATANLIVFQKPILNKYEPSVVTLTYYSIGGILTLILCIVGFYNFRLSDLYFDNETLPWLGLAYASTFATFFTFNSLSWAAKQLSPSATTTYATFQPVGTILLSYFLFGHIITIQESIGAVLVISGLIVTVVGQSMEKSIGD